MARGSLLRDGIVNSLIFPLRKILAILLAEFSVNQRSVPFPDTMYKAPLFLVGIAYSWMTRAPGVRDPVAGWHIIAAKRNMRRTKGPTSRITFT